MATKPLNSRRSFIKRSGLLLSSLGLTSTVQSGLMDSILKKAVHKWGAEALGQSTNTVHFCLEICIRAGFQINSLFPSAGHGSAARSNRMNIYSSPAGSAGGILNTTATGPQNRPLHYAQFRRGATMEGAQSLVEGPTNFAPYIATTEAINLTNGHSEDWRLRRPLGTSPVPAVLHNAYAPASAVKGLVFGNGAIGNNANGIVFNQPGTLKAGNLTSQVANRTGFLKLFDSIPIYFTQDELKLIVGAVSQGAVIDNRHGALGDIDSLFLARGVQGADDLRAVTLAGRGQTQLNYGRSLAFDGLAANLNNNVVSNNVDATATGDAAIVSNFGGLEEMQRSIQGNEPIGLTLASIYKGWKSQALTTAVVALNSADWHGFDNPGALTNNPMGQQGMWNIALGNALNGLLRSMAVTPDPYGGGGTMLDSFLIVISSEFTRTPDRTDGAGVGTNNNDGGTQGVVLIGSKVKGGTYGDVAGNLSIVGFNPMDGSPSGSVRPSEASIYKAIGRLAGIDGAVVDSYAPADPIAQCLIK